VSGIVRTAEGSVLSLVRARPPHPAAAAAPTTARQNRLARLRRPRDIPVIDPLPA
jgi:hypothetical protein